MGDAHQLEQKGTYSKVLPKTKVKSLGYINTYKKYKKYKKSY